MLSQLIYRRGNHFILITGAYEACIQNDPKLAWSPCKSRCCSAQRENCSTFFSQLHKLQLFHKIYETYESNSSTGSVVEWKMCWKCIFEEVVKEQLRPYYSLLHFEIFFYFSCKFLGMVACLSNGNWFWFLDGFRIYGVKL